MIECFLKWLNVCLSSCVRPHGRDIITPRRSGGSTRPALLCSAANLHEILSSVPWQLLTEVTFMWLALCTMCTITVCGSKGVAVWHVVMCVSAVVHLPSCLIFPPTSFIRTSSKSFRRQRTPPQSITASEKILNFKQCKRRYTVHVTHTVINPLWV